VARWPTHTTRRRRYRSTTCTYISNWLNWPSLLWSVGASLTQTLFDAGRRRAASEVALANYDALVATCRQTTLTAFQQVEDNLVALRVLAQEAEEQRRAVLKNEQLMTAVNQQPWDPCVKALTQFPSILASLDKNLVWQGNARTIFGALQAAGIRPILTLRHVENYGTPAWAQRLNPPRSPEDWNEWWEHVFATVYWLNVHNDYHVNDFEVHNEPNNATEG
jgi:hypothetical protein